MADEEGAVANELVAAGAGEAVDGAGYGEDIAVLFVGVASGVESPGAGGGFDEKDAEGESADDAVSLGEEAGEDGLIEGHFGEECAVSGDVVGEGLMFGWVDGIEAAWEYSEGAAGGVECGAVGGGINAAGESADDGEAGAGELGGEAFGLANTVHGTASGTNDGDCEFVLGQE
jgi:hypothetical protein